MKLSTTNKRLLSNTGFLYLMTISVQILNLLTIPYLTRVLGPAVYGRIGLAQGYMSYVQIILDFGFILSATQMISEHSNDKKVASMVIASVSTIKLFLTGIVAIVFVPLSFLVGSIVALLFSVIDIKVRYKIKLIVPQMAHIKALFKTSIPFFVSRFASTFYQALDVIILGRVYGSAPVVGYYTSCDKAITLSKMASSPIADSLYPYMLKNKNFKLVKKILLLCMPIITGGVILIAIFAEPLCVFAFGKEYAGAGNVLRLLLPIAWVILPTYIIAFPVMSPLGLVKYANRSNIIGMFIQISGLIILKFVGVLNVYTICGLTSLTEVSVFVYRLLTVMLRKKLKLGDA